MYTLRARLALICGFLAIALVIVGSTGFISLHTVGDTYKHVAEINLPNANLLQQMSTATGSAIRQLIRLGYTKLSDDDIMKLEKEYLNHVEQYEAADKKYQEVPFVDGEAELYEKLAADWKSASVTALKLIEIRKKGDLEPFHALLEGDLRINIILTASPY